MTGRTEAMAAAMRLDQTPPIPAIPRWDQRLERPKISLRWVLANAAILLVSAALLIGVLRVVARTTVKPMPASYAIRDDGSDLLPTSERHDRLSATAPVPPARRNVQVRVEALRSSGASVVPLTYLVAHLGRDAPTEPAAPGPKAGARVAGASAPPAAAGATPALPPEILVGGSEASPPALPTAYAAMPNPEIEPGPRGVALNVSVVPGSRRPADEPDRVVLALRGDRLGTILGVLGLQPDDVADVVAAMAQQGVPPLFTGGEKVVIRHGLAGGPDGRSRAPIIRVERPGGAVAVAALADSGHYRPGIVSGSSQSTALATTPASDTDPVMPEHGSLRDSLAALSQHRVADRPLVDTLMRLAGTDVDLGDAVSPEDTAELLYGPPRSDSPDPVLDYAALTADGTTHRFYRYDSADDGSTDYYDAQGHSATKFLLRKPVANGILGDGFGWRIHPVLHDRRFHQGVDYRAPYGSPIVAAGAGVVEKIDFETGYGKYIRVRHDLGYETTYAHVSGFAPGMRVGTRVRQGETIAYVGSTGYSTGSHLYYEVKINDRNVDPLRIRLQGGRVLQGPALAAFARYRERVDVIIKASGAVTTGKRS